ncbi:diguanylate cyclase [Desulfitobacterium metallireducens DSM 15288]|uniref:Diguanylate cyclase n=1 Tax=Desulfitobacterium metallireducens DSM 15288 TaxID=871968 RepID=W0E8G0_9FIRM|nr:diguanylate cyclase [Desulfitobacterium metallireducens DSM 15288]
MESVFEQKIQEYMPILQHLLSAICEKEHEWIVTNRKKVLYTSPGAFIETGIFQGMSTEELPWFKEILYKKDRVVIKKQGWRADSEKRGLIVGVPLLDESAEVQGACFSITEFHDKIRANDVLNLAQDMAREEDQFAALKIVTRRVLDLFQVSMVGVWLWTEGEYGVVSVSTSSEELRSYVENKLPPEFGLDWVNHFSKTEKNEQHQLIRYNLDQLNEAWVKPLKEFGLVTLVSIPLNHFGQTLGQIVLFTQERENIDNENIYWLRQIVPFVSSFVYEQQLRMAALEREQALTLLLRGTEILVQADTEEQLLTEAGEMAMEILFLPGGFFFLYEQGEWIIRAPFGRLKQAEWAWKDWVWKQMERDKYDRFTNPHAVSHFLEVGDNPEHWRKILIQPIVNHSGLMGELWLMDDLEWVTEQRQEIVSAYVRDVGVALDAIRQRDELSHLASTDRLTGILNRQGFDHRIREEMAGTLRRQSSFLLLILDLDFFKRLNDTQGHPAGDLALKTLAQNLCASVRESDIVSRTGGDEFTVVLTDLHFSPEARKVIERMKGNLGLKQFGLDVSIGVVEFPAEGRNYEELYRLADQRLYIGKNMGKGQIVFH